MLRFIDTFSTFSLSRVHIHPPHTRIHMCSIELYHSRLRLIVSYTSDAHSSSCRIMGIFHNNDIFSRSDFGWSVRCVWIHATFCIKFCINPEKINTIFSGHAYEAVCRKWQSCITMLKNYICTDILGIDKYFGGTSVHFFGIDFVIYSYYLIVIFWRLSFMSSS